ncbi:hypothetical protein NEIFL0001_0306 [Neisseria flavescens SK114]|nr:hypothetical protein NEIFL0001_0306 [Neisseria flavescens SK114]
MPCPDLNLIHYIYSDGQQSKGRLKNRFSDGLYLPDGG